MRKTWKVALIGGPRDGKVMDAYALGNKFVALGIARTGQFVDHYYHYTGYVPRLKVAFAKYLRSRISS